MSQTETDDSKIQNLLQRIREKSLQGEYIYRGETEQYEKISSTLYRQYAKQIQAEKFDIRIAQEEMLEQVKAYTDFTDETDVLTELQHYGGKTNLIDFTTDYLTALFFACDAAPNEDGRVILLNKNTSQGKVTSPKKNLNNRVISQKSIFFQSPKGYLDEKEAAVEIISIPKEMKQPVLDYLRKYHDIATPTIYNDIFGYIQNQEKNQTAYAAFYIGLTAHRKGKYEEAIRHYNQVIRINPQAATTYTNRGAAKADLGRYAEAIADYDLALRMNPQDAGAYSNRGTAKGVLGRHEEAIADLNEALRINPNHAKDYYNRGFSKYFLGQHEEAILDYDQVIRMNPQDADAYNLRGNAIRELGRHEAAIEDFDQAIRINPQSAGFYYNRGVVKGMLGRHEAAIEDFDQAVHINPQYAEVYGNRATVKGMLGRYEDAIADFNETIHIKPEDSVAYANRGNAKRALGQHDEAIADYDQAIRIDPKNAAAYYNRGTANKEIEEYENAAPTFNVFFNWQRNKTTKSWPNTLGHFWMNYRRPAVRIK